MKQLALFLLLANLVIASPYIDEELDQLWSSLSDINHPTVEDYRLIDHYLATGTRPYLDPLRESVLQDWGFSTRFQRILNFQLLGEAGELPIFEKHALNLRKGTEKRCILLYSSQNAPYPEKARKMIAKLKKCGYSGHVLLRIGGFPNIENGGVKICHVPYAFKAAFFREAERLGFAEILWLDTSLQPVQNLESIFTEMEKRGHYFTYTGSLNDNFPTFNFPETAKALDITFDDYPHIPHLATAIIGFNMGNPRAKQLMDEWYQETERTIVNIAWFPEEIAVSVAAWRLGCEPVCWLGFVMGEVHEYYFQSHERPNLQFFVDKIQ